MRTESAISAVRCTCACVSEECGLGGSRFWFLVPFRRNGIKIGINLNCDWTISILYSISKREFLKAFRQTSTFGCKMDAHAALLTDTHVHFAPKRWAVRRASAEGRAATEKRQESAKGPRE